MKAFVILFNYTAAISLNDFELLKQLKVTRAENKYIPGSWDKTIV